jgi:hypothetical protein
MSARCRWATSDLKREQDEYIEGVMVFAYWSLFHPHK